MNKCGFTIVSIVYSIGVVVSYHAWTPIINRSDDVDNKQLTKILYSIVWLAPLILCTPWKTRLVRQSRRKKGIKACR